MMKEIVGSFMRGGLWRVLLEDGTDRPILDKAELNAVPLIGAAASRVAPLLKSRAEAFQACREALLVLTTPEDKQCGDEIDCAARWLRTAVGDPVDSADCGCEPGDFESCAADDPRPCPRLTGGR